MFGTEIVGQFVDGRLRANGAVTAVVGNSIANLGALPGDKPLPGVLHYAEDAPYGGEIDAGDDLAWQQIRYLVRFICEGESSEPIRAAAKAMLLDFRTSPIGTTAYDGETYGLTFVAVGEWPLTTVLEDGVFYRQLGTYFQVDVMRGG